METYLDFERPIAVLEKQLTDLRELEAQGGVNLQSEIRSLEAKLAQLMEETYSNLSPWQRVQLSRHPHRPYTRDYIDGLFPDFMELHGDRTYGEDPALLAGFATLSPGTFGLHKGSAPQTVAILGHQKGRTTKQKMLYNFGMAKPEGYRKAMRVMELANRMKIPILTFIDTPGAYPGLETEERGQAQAIAESLRLMFSLDVPIISVVIGEGGSGGALAIGVANTILMQEFSTYSVISPEGCATILWNDAREADRASQVLKMTSIDLQKLGVIDGVVPEPLGGAQRDWPKAFEMLRESLSKHLGKLLTTNTKKKPGMKAKGRHDFRSDRIEKFRAMGLDAMTEAK